MLLKSKGIVISFLLVTLRQWRMSQQTHIHVLYLLVYPSLLNIQNSVLEEPHYPSPSHFPGVEPLSSLSGLCSFQPFLTSQRGLGFNTWHPGGQWDHNQPTVIPVIKCKSSWFSDNEQNCFLKYEHIGKWKGEKRWERESRTGRCLTLTELTVWLGSYFSLRGEEACQPALLP